MGGRNLSASGIKTFHGDTGSGQRWMLCQIRLLKWEQEVKACERRNKKGEEMFGVSQRGKTSNGTFKLTVRKKLS